MKLMALWEGGEGRGGENHYNFIFSILVDHGYLKLKAKSFMQPLNDETVPKPGRLSPAGGIPPT